ncbi:uncharacterized protein LOC129881944 [Solanum dulcamara]|uniref:uncharacterized protein LOC129881944 n=1 Tax=Solanum dulcamara TaxID=45834 RepID=UPI0024850632|nr:uncharacterized protein LOC129881944 [Solanum dulcamara]
MGSKAFMLIVLSIFLVITSEVAARELAQRSTTSLDNGHANDAKLLGMGFQGYLGGLGFPRPEIGGLPRPGIGGLPETGGFLRPGIRGFPGIGVGGFPWGGFGGGGGREYYGDYPRGGGFYPGGGYGGGYPRGGWYGGLPRN